ncbi:prolyl oligopeptidase family serine peptidase [Pseudoduganella sp. FT93W]|uniref:Prolyl oligopeptidase family serine peptidase n=1 Tax=Duganella fentianensis TaxID=2692177 RepID=A0A845I1B7_9BURK|nr:alpha/beta fold hydrolase [Duganella fentianensis]MYN47320.1 prolyl oligopeptidase family serine peptidase [Duganella fentianensis]
MRFPAILRQLGLLAALLSPAIHAAPPALPDVANFFKADEISHVALSPKGAYIASTVRLPDGTQALVVRETADLTQFKVITRNAVEHAEIVSVHWINEQRLGFTVKNMQIEFDGNWDEFAADRDGEHRVHLIAGNWDYRQESLGSRNTSRTLTAEYGFYDTAHDGSDDILVEKHIWNSTDLLPDHSRLYRLNTRTQILRKAFEGNQPEAAEHWITDSKDAPRVVSSTIKGRCISYFRNPEDTEWKELSNGVCYTDQRFQPLFFDGANTLFVRATYNDYGALFRYDLKAKQMGAEPIVETPGFDFTGAPEIDRATGRLLGFQLHTDAATTVWLDPKLKAEQAKIDAALPSTINSVSCAQDCSASPVLLIAAVSDRQPLQYILYNRASGALIGLGSTRANIAMTQVGARSFHHYQARDGHRIPVYVTLPAGKPAGPQPAIVLVHGGPQMRGSSWEWDSQAAFLSSRGYVVIQPEFRGSIGFGAQHFQAGWRQWGLSMQDDLTDAARWAVKQGWADSRRIALMGASYGGYATLMGLIKEPQVFRCGVEWAGVTDINLMFSSTESDMSQDWLGYGARTLIGDPEQDAEQFRATSPLLRAAELKQPLLMAHGARDRRVPLEHARKFANAVKAGNANVSYLIYDNEGHGWLHDDNNIDFWSKVESFLDKNLKHAN